MGSSTLNDELRRFIQTIVSIPHLEAMLLLRQFPEQEWDKKTIAQRLYLTPAQTATMLGDLSVAGVCVGVAGQPGKFSYAPAFAELSDLIDQLAEYYAQNLIEVTNMIHSRANASRRAQQFADAFKFKKDP